MTEDQLLFIRCCLHGDLGIAKAMVLGLKKLDIHFEDDRAGISLTPLFWAAKNGQVEVVKWLLESGAKTYSSTHNKEQLIGLMEANTPEIRHCIDMIRQDTKPSKKPGWFF